MFGKHASSNIHLVIKEIALVSVKMGNAENEIGLYKNNASRRKISLIHKYPSLLKAWLPTLLTKVIDVSQKPQDFLQGLKG